MPAFVRTTLLDLQLGALEALDNLVSYIYCILYNKDIKLKLTTVAEQVLNTIAVQIEM